MSQSKPQKRPKINSNFGDEVKYWTVELNTVSKRQLNRIFKKYFDKGTMEYYRELRLDKAKNLLRNSSLSIAEISLMTGFYSSSHFSSLFVNYFDIPPTQYRNSGQMPYISRIR